MGEDFLFFLALTGGETDKKWQFQFGFRKNKSTISELLTLFETLQEAKEAGKHIGLILYDLSAAFDTVEPGVLVEKLKIYGFDYTSRKWMESYLMGRKQVTAVEEKQSQLYCF